MKLLLSESQPDYSRYSYPYAVWAFPEDHETPADLLNAGFLPARTLERFYLCRHIRVDLRRFSPSSENRRILRKGDGIALKLLPRSEFEFTTARRDFAKQFAEARFGPDVMTYERLDATMASSAVTHILAFEESATGRELGFAVLYVERPRAAHYWFAFYDLEYLARNLGMFMMTSSVKLFAEQKFEYLYLGTCYSQRALYKWQFVGCEFSNGYRWSDNLQELKYLVKRQGENRPEHLLEDGYYLEEFAGKPVKELAHWSVPLQS